MLLPEYPGAGSQSTPGYIQNFDLTESIIMSSIDPRYGTTLSEFLIRTVGVVTNRHVQNCGSTFVRDCLNFADATRAMATSGTRLASTTIRIWRDAKPLR